MLSKPMTYTVILDELNITLGLPKLGLVQMGVYFPSSTLNWFHKSFEAGNCQTRSVCPHNQC